ncbi:23S rRNA (pseudouridine(1915)-N(3))-methyltransferase RlmH [Acuticoccus kandeliae]|uniref:23S rRNA (pseudouridine(1915)-N(3))-methyltransferase RlmH n=1 Tax=Acuticoccus kandeliae TaxID=2073160 RepID=UPI00196A694A|nr:23S rRNA (pseudouridine(1915)-N(3))-methyltransferase RlmH [Acuticoccus kandeliae]
MADGKLLPRGARRLNILVLAVGKASKGPERELCARYLERASKSGRPIGLSSVEVRELPDAQGPTRAAIEGERILGQRPAGRLVALDETGAGWSSMAFADRLQGWLDRGEPTITFAIGGADGLSDPVRAAADHLVSLGAITLPHLLARAILLEQIYRAVTIRLGHPYHRA